MRDFFSVGAELHSAVRPSGLRSPGACANSPVPLNIVGVSAPIVAPKPVTMANVSPAPMRATQMPRITLATPHAI